MAVDYTRLLYDPIYGALGVDAVLTPNRAEAEPIDMRVLDKTSGVEVSERIDIVTLRPAATIRVRSLLEADLTTDDLDGGTLAWDDTTWTIQQHHDLPAPDGKSSGEVMCYLMDESAYA